jgi:hypothetical protein
VRLSGRTRLILLVLVLLVTLMFYAPFLHPTSQAPQIGVPYSTFLAQIRAHHVATVLLSPRTASGAFATPYRDLGSGKRFARYTTTLLPLPDPALVPLLKGAGVPFTAENQTRAGWLTVLGLFSGVLPLLLLVGLFYIGTRAARGRQRGILGCGRSTARLYTVERLVDVDDVVRLRDTARALERHSVRRPTQTQHAYQRVAENQAVEGRLRVVWARQRLAAELIDTLLAPLHRAHAEEEEALRAYERRLATGGGGDAHV